MQEYDSLDLASMANDLYIGCTYYIYLLRSGRMNSTIVRKYFARAQEFIDVLKMLASSKFSRYLFWGSDDLVDAIPRFEETVPKILGWTASKDEVEELRNFADAIATKILFRVSAARYIKIRS